MRGEIRELQAKLKVKVKMPKDVGALQQQLMAAKTELRNLKVERKFFGRTLDEARDELAASHCPMPPVPQAERIAHLGTADCCIHPPGRNEMIAITPPKIFSKEVAPKQATPLTAPATSLTTRNSFKASFRG
jgi:hypothetical protein